MGVGAQSEKKSQLADAVTRAAEQRKQFETETKLEIVTVPNPKFLQVDFRKPKVRFPDGSERHFEEGTPETTIAAQVKEKALEKYPVPNQDRPPFKVTPPEIEKTSVWEATVPIDGERRELDDIAAWDYYFPMDGIAKILNTLAGEGWAVAHVSEDRGLCASDIASNMSAPINVRYLLTRD